MMRNGTDVPEPPVPEPPDFDQIAATIGIRFDHSVGGAMMREIAAQLREVWNARGAADAKAVQARTVELVTGPVVGAWIARFAETIHALDVETVWQDGQNHARIPHDRDVEIP